MALASFAVSQYKDIYPPGQQHSMIGMLTKPMGDMMSKYNGKVSKNYCLVRCATRPFFLFCELPFCAQRAAPFGCGEVR